MCKIISETKRIQRKTLYGFCLHCAVFTLLVLGQPVLVVHCKCFDHKNYGDWKLQGPCRENLHYLRKRAVRIAGFPRNCGVFPQFLQSFSIDIADFPCRNPAISSPRSFYGQNICSVVFEPVAQMARIEMVDEREYQKV